MKNKLFFKDRNCYKIDLPGKSLIDPIKDVYVKTFTLEDIYNISTIALQQDVNRLMEFIQSHVDIDIDSITESDFKYILFWERFQSYSYHPLLAEFNCKSCYSLNKEEINSDNINYKEFNTSYEKEGLNIKLYSEELINWKIPTLGDSKKARSFLEENKIPEDHFSILEIACCVTFAENPELSLKDKFKKIKNLSADNFVIFNFLKSEYCDFGIKESANLTCKHCGVCQEVRFQFELYDLFPDFRNSESVRSRILPNNKSNEFKSEQSDEGGIREADISPKKTPKRNGNTETKSESIEQHNRSNQKITTFGEFLNNNE